MVVSAAQPRQLAQAGLFPRLLTTAARSLAPAGHSPDTVTVQALVTEIRKHLTGPARPGPARQSIVADGIRFTAGEPPFLHNPYHRRGMTDIDLALQQAREWEEHAERREVEFRTLAVGAGDGQP